MTQLLFNRDDELAQSWGLQFTIIFVKMMLK